MNNEEIEKFIEEIEKTISKDKAYFGYSYNEDFGYAKGNKEGLLLYSAELLKAAKEIESRKFDEGDNEIFNPSFEWVESQDENPFDYIQITNKDLSEIIDSEKSKNNFWKDKLYGFGCIAIVIFTLFLAIIGLVSFIKWF